VSVPRPSFHVQRHTRQASPPDPSWPSSSDTTIGYGTSEVVDLDGDGQLDVLAPEPAEGDCVGDMHLAVYLSRGACGHRVGVIQGQIDVAGTRAARRSHGLLDVHTTIEETVQPDPRVPAVRRTRARRYRFDGTRYTLASERTTRAVCHHCPLESCVIVPAP
jgi:hypothetical protein